MSGRPVDAVMNRDSPKPGASSLKQHHALAKRFSGFALISGIGWCLDFMTMATLTYSGVPVFWANFIGAFCGVTFVFFVAGKRIFRKAHNRSMATLLLLYWIWQLVAVTAASALTAGVSLLLLAMLDQVGGTPILTDLGANIVTLTGVSAKMLVTPFTLIANFFFMRFLLETPKSD
ncbi:GtrA family protein [Roseibium sediminicola]|uniref:GtrA family protein n=1 Tax=Roseibium sediminicola TaxID=2933272 RepID=A0ABT0H371_9HYPH|nr:GtrA family protein [Roseibium sp. CAU 1639]MCK7616076.1 GtrA family protein [Roseibium sp. CAU 1639]